MNKEGFAWLPSSALGRVGLEIVGVVCLCALGMAYQIYKRGSLYTRKKTPLELAIKGGYATLEKYLRENKNIDLNKKDSKGDAVLHDLVIHKDNNELVKLMFEHGANKNLKNRAGDTALHIAVRYQNHETVKTLLGCGVDKDIQNNDGETPFHLAMVHYNNEVTKLLLEAHVERDVKDNRGLTPLHLAVIYENIEAIKILLHANADPNIQDNDGDTPLHRAAINGGIESIKILLDYMANKNIKNSEGFIPFDCAVNNKHQDAMLVLLDYKPRFLLPLLMCHKYSIFSKIPKCLLFYITDSYLHVTTSVDRTPTTIEEKCLMLYEKTKNENYLKAIIKSKQNLN